MSEKEKCRFIRPDDSGDANLFVFPDINDNTVLTKLQDEIDTRFTPKKASTLVLSDVYVELDMLSRASRVANCGAYLEFKVSEKEKKLYRAYFCKDRLCPMCNWRRSLKIFGQVSQVMDHLEKDTYRFLFLTLTVKNCSADDLPATVNALFEGWRFMYNKSSVFRKVVCGTFRTVEVTRNKKTGEFHPHLHVILAVRPSYFTRGYLSQADWSELWRSCCDLGYNPIVDIRKIKGDSGGISGAVAEVSKYAVKDGDYLSGCKDDRLACVSAFLSALTKRRLVDFTGCFRKVRKQLKLDDVEQGDLVNVDGDVLREDVTFLIVRYAWRSGVYVRL